ncbi:MAG: CRISPR-associated endonuclease Cas3'' [Victivallaceae bacterium]|nr:CRISPR-associated endonuclease Cas3'' [Victivallaceae bacterium]
MKLCSHGGDSDLREHLAEVMTAAETPEERIICACHDLGKATVRWQQYIRGRSVKSPHHHAAAGGLFAALLLLRLNGADAAAWALTALHVGAAHHSYLQELGENELGDIAAVAADENVYSFIADRKDGIASLLPEIPDADFKAAWEAFKRLAPPGSPERQALNLKLDEGVPADQRVKIYLRSRSLLGRLCIQDHRSAARQSGKDVEVSDWRGAFPDRQFVSRKARVFPVAGTVIADLRSRLRDAFLQTVAGGKTTFYFIDAPTGLGKTEAMLRGAESLLAGGDFRRIVFAVPQVSVADQVFDDYFSGCAAQIWNFRRREKADGAVPPESVAGAGVDAQAFEIEQHPFDEPYNVTTFNQVLLAMCHPNRNRCIRGLGLRDAVVIMDEFHKLPQVILPLFFRMAREYAAQFNCRFILGSATPLALSAFVPGEDVSRIPAEVTVPIYQRKEVDGRRFYRGAGKLTAAELAGRINDFQRNSDRSLLVVVNLVGGGSWALRRCFDRGFQPWNDLTEADSPGTGRLMVWLDGLVPPGLRRELLAACRRAMRERPLTLISTQMVEVGVDLDFDAALVDYQGLAATIQRGGRVGREGRDKPCEVEVFSLVNEDKSSFEQLISAREKNAIRLKVPPFDKLYRYEQHFLLKEQRFFDNWGEHDYHDSDLAAKLTELQGASFSGTDGNENCQKLFSVDQVSSQNIGASFQKAQFVAELFDSENGDPIVLVESQECYDELRRLNTKIGGNASSAADRQRFLQMLADRTITPSGKVRFELGVVCCGYIDYPDHMGVYRLDSLVL